MFAAHAGYNGVAEVNNLIVLYPQIVKTLLNPVGCWDWYVYGHEKLQLVTVSSLFRWGYTGPHYGMWHCLHFMGGVGIVIVCVCRCKDRCADGWGEVNARQNSWSVGSVCARS